ncbi:MAG: hypothetical protein U0P30_08955 [Vicinamibacterales bacterium]
MTWRRLVAGGSVVAAVLGLVPAASPQAQAPTGVPARVVKVVGDAHHLLLRADGTVAGWGRYKHGQLGPVAAITATPRGASNALVAIALPSKAVDIAANSNASYALLDDGTVLAWGRGDVGQLGTGPAKPPRLATSEPSFEYRGIETPTRVPGVVDAVAIAAANDSAYAVLRDGTVRAWGGANIGDGRAKSDFSGPPSTAGPAFLPVKVPDLENVVAMSAGNGHVLALTKEGHVFSWGSNFHGALGRPPRVELALDRAGEVPNLADVVQVAAGWGISTVLKKDGTVWVWGSNFQQQFGFPAPTVQPGPNQGWVLEPQQVPGLTNVTAISAGGRHTVVLLKDGTLRAWGNTDWGQVGNGAGPGFQPKPVAPKIANVAAVFAAGDNTLAVLRDGSLWAWGTGNANEFPLASHTRVPTVAPPGLR